VGVSKSPASVVSKLTQFAGGGPDHSTPLTRTRHRPRPGAVVFPPIRRGTVERSAPSCVDAPASRCGDACSGSGSPFPRWHGIQSPPGLSATGVGQVSRPQAAGDGTETGRRGDPKAASRGVSHRGEPRGARHAAGTRQHLPWGSFPFGEVSTGDRSASVYLADAFRPQGFSPSRRFPPTGAVWLCFTPLPPIGFWPSELFPLNQPWRLSTLVALLPLGQRRPCASRPAPVIAPAFVNFPEPIRFCRSSHLVTRATPRNGLVISHRAHRRTGVFYDERPTPSLKRRRRTPRQASTDPFRTSEARLGRAWTPDSRALLRLSSRSLPGTVRHPEKPMLS